MERFGDRPARRFLLSILSHWITLYGICFRSSERKERRALIGESASVVTGGPARRLKPAEPVLDHVYPKTKGLQHGPYMIRPKRCPHFSEADRSHKSHRGGQMASG